MRKVKKRDREGKREIGVGGREKSRRRRGEESKRRRNRVRKRNKKRAKKEELEG